MSLKKIQKYIISFCIIGIVFSISSATAKMSPLMALEEQIVAPNILIILDTSGSMQRDTAGNALSATDSQGRKYGAHEDSRLYIAKEVVTTVLDDCRGLANFGLMSFKQMHYMVNSDHTRGYFPYYKIAASSPDWENQYFTIGNLSMRIYKVGGVSWQSVYDPWGETLADTFEFRGNTYYLVDGNSRYRRYIRRFKPKYVYHDFCGYNCRFEDPDNHNLYTWTFRGSYYRYDKNQGSGDIIYLKEFYGQQFKADGTEDDDGGASASIDPNDVPHEGLFQKQTDTPLLLWRYPVTDYHNLTKQMPRPVHPVSRDLLRSTTFSLWWKKEILWCHPSSYQSWP